MVTDEYVIARFMESRPTWDPSLPGTRLTETEWWVSDYSGLPWEWRPKKLTLDRLWLVEAKLTPEQVLEYDRVLAASGSQSPRSFVWHATAEQKVTALAIVIAGA